MAKTASKSGTPSRVRRVALIGNHLPRRCGIATFTTDLAAAIAGVLPRTGCVEVVAMDDVVEGYDYPERVKFQINAKSADDYARAADFININRFDLVVLQHEYGIFGGADGSRILTTLERLQMPILTTLHTVLADPSQGQRKVLDHLSRLSSRLVVMSHRAVDMLVEIYGIPREHVVLIPHGIPDVPFSDPSFFKDTFGIERNKVILTFGLLGPSKGLETAIDAMPAIIAKHPDAVYVLLGATHPHIVKESGEAYRQSLVQRARKLKVEDHLLFHNRFVNLEELTQHLSSADVYVTPYPNEAQITSGTLAYACGCGKAVVSTPYWYAQELLGEGRGILVPFNDPAAIAASVNRLLTDDHERNAIRKASYQHCRDMIWSNVGRYYVELGATAIAECRQRPRQRPARQKGEVQAFQELPEPMLDHLRHLSDHTGVLRNARYSVPDRDAGYRTEDNARALVGVAMHHHRNTDERSYRMMQRYLSFLLHAFDTDTGRFRSRMAYDRTWCEESGSEDSHGVALWALGVAVKYHPTHEICEMCAGLLTGALHACEDFRHPRAIAYALVGLHAYLEIYSGASDARRLRAILADRLMSHFRERATPGWPWFDERVTYAGGMVCLALLLSGQWLPDEEIFAQGMQSLRWLIDCQTGGDGQLSLIGNQHWFNRDGTRSAFDQEPLAATELLLACNEAYRATRTTPWLADARRCLDWFLGRNDCSLRLCDLKTGACADTLQPQHINANQGAESTIAWLIAQLAIHEISDAMIKETQTARRFEKPVQE